MADPALLVERRHRLGAQPLAARRPHLRHRHVGIDLADHALDHVAALVDLGDQRVGLERAKERDRPRRPVARRAPRRRIVGEHVDAAVRRPRPAATMPQASGVRPPAPAGRPPPRSASAPARRGPRRLDHRPRPQRALGGPRRSRRRAPAGRAACRRSAPSPPRGTRRQVAPVGAVAARASRRSPGSAISRLQQRRSAAAWSSTTARGRAPSRSAELQHVPGVASAWRHLRELVAPGGVELRPAQALGVLGGEDLRDRAVRPDQPPARRLPVAAGRGGDARRGARTRLRPSPRARRRRSRRPGRSGRPARPRMVRPERHGAHPFGAGARLAGAAAAEDQPGAARAARAAADRAAGEERPPVVEGAKARSRQASREARQGLSAASRLKAFRNISAQRFHVIGRSRFRGAPRHGRGGVAAATISRSMAVSRRGAGNQRASARSRARDPRTRPRPYRRAPRLSRMRLEQRAGGDDGRRRDRTEPDARDRWHSCRPAPCCHAPSASSPAARRDR